MPSGKQGRGRQNGGADREDRGPISNAVQHVQGGVQQAGQHLQETYESAAEEAARRYRRAEGLMARNPTPSVLIALGFGFGIGLVLTAIVTRPEETWADRHLPEGLRDTVRHAPDSFHHLAEAVRNLPDAIASRLPSRFSRS